jgi:hypothetical protein
MSVFSQADIKFVLGLEIREGCFIAPEKKTGHCRISPSNRLSDEHTCQINSLAVKDYGTAVGNLSYHKHLAKTTENEQQENICLVTQKFRPMVYQTPFRVDGVSLSLPFSSAVSAKARFSQPSRI